MGVTGPKPREDRSQVRFKGHTAEWTEVDDVPFASPPALPDRDVVGSWGNAAENGVLPGGWPESTARWYGVISRMPHACLWTDADWEFVFATAETHARFAEGWKGASGSELRQREKLIGVYADARRDLRIRYIEPKRGGKLPAGTGTEGNVVSINHFRDL
jgi:hypothetical protein